MRGDTLPVGAEVCGALRLGKCTEQVDDEYFVGFSGVVVLGFQL